MKKILEYLFLVSLAIFFFVASSNEVFALSATKNTMFFKFKNYPLTSWTGTKVFDRLSVQLNDNLNDNSVYIQAEFYNIQYEKIVLNGSFCMSVSFDGRVFDRSGKEIKKTNNVCVFEDKSVGMRYDFKYTSDLAQFSDSNMGTYMYDFRIEKKTVEWTFFQFLSLNYSPYDSSDSIISSITNTAQMIIDMKNQAIQNKDEIINNQDKNASDIMNNFTQNIQNQINNANKNQQETNDRLDNINDSITDESPPDKLSGLSGSAGWLPAGPVDSIINLPLNFFQSLNNSLNKTCDPLILDTPFVEDDIELPCVNTIYAQIPNFNSLYTWIGRITSLFILYYYLMSLYKWVDDTLTFRENTWQDWGGV